MVRGEVAQSEFHPRHCVRLGWFLPSLGLGFPSVGEVCWTFPNLRTWGSEIPLIWGSLLPLTHQAHSYLLGPQARAQGQIFSRRSYKLFQRLRKVGVKAQGR